MNKRLFGLASVLIATLAALPALSPAGASAACVVAPVAAHRGNWDGRYPDNSRNGFRYTQNKDPKAWWETDVDVVDGQFVIRHDSTAPVLMTLDDLLNDMSVDGVQAFVELKWSPTEEQWGGLLALIDKYNLRSKIVLTSFSGDTMLAAEAHAGNIRRGLIESTGYTTAANITKWHVQYYLKHSDSFTYARAQEWLGAGLILAAWSDHLSNNPDEWLRLNSYVKLMITDTGASYDSWAASRGCTPTKK